jgi:hypothetical protein
MPFQADSLVLIVCKILYYMIQFIHNGFTQLLSIYLPILEMNSLLVVR